MRLRVEKGVISPNLEIKIPMSIKGEKGFKREKVYFTLKKPNNSSTI